MNYWKDLYAEIAERITVAIPEIQWCDLWHDQVGYLSAEYPFQTPAVFLSFNTVNIADKGILVQDVDVQMDVFLFFETFADTFAGSYNKTVALDFLDMLNKLHALFHGRNGNNYNTMRRVDMRRVDSGGAGNLYRISFQFLTVDYSAQTIWGEGSFADVAVLKGEISIQQQDDGGFYEVNR